jgi:hypothetical protein
MPCPYRVAVTKLNVLKVLNFWGTGMRRFFALAVC